VAPRSCCGTPITTQSGIIKGQGQMRFWWLFKNFIWKATVQSRVEHSLQWLKRMRQNQPGIGPCVLGGGVALAVSSCWHCVALAAPDREACTKLSTVSRNLQHDLRARSSRSGEKAGSVGHRRPGVHRRRRRAHIDASVPKTRSRKREHTFCDLLECFCDLRLDISNIMLQQQERGRYRGGYALDALGALSMVPASAGRAPSLPSGFPPPPRTAQPTRCRLRDILIVDRTCHMADRSDTVRRMGEWENGPHALNYAGPIDRINELPHSGDTAVQGLPIVVSRGPAGKIYEVQIWSLQRVQRGGVCDVTI
jgi:hypothetical protein